MDMLEDRTCIFISHRLGAVRNMDEILVVDNGVLCEAGSHEKLMQLNGIYNKLYSTQREMYIMNKSSRNVSLQCLQTALKLMPTHFAFRLALSIFMAVLPLLGMSMSRSIYSYVEASSNSPQVLSALVFPLSMYAIYLILTKAYTVYYQRVAVQFGAILTFEKKIKLLLHKKTGEIDMRFYEDPSFYNSLWEFKLQAQIFIV